MRNDSTNRPTRLGIENASHATVARLCRYLLERDPEITASDMVTAVDARLGVSCAEWEDLADRLDAWLAAGGR
jgi:hypothetical protein